MKKNYWLVGLVLTLILLYSGVVFAATGLEVLGVELDGLEEIGMPQIWSQEEFYATQGVQFSVSEYSKDVENLALLGLIPDMEVNWEDYATRKLLASILTKLDERKSGIVPVNLLENSSLEHITYLDAAAILLELLDYGKKNDPQAVNSLRKLGIKVNKVNVFDYITGEELAHLIYNTLHQKQVNHKKNILEDVYIGNFQLAKAKILLLNSDKIELEYQGTFNLSDNLIIFKVDQLWDLTPISYNSLTVGMDNVYLFVDNDNIVQCMLVVGEYAPEYLRVLISSGLSSVGSSSSYDFTDIRMASDKEIKVINKTPQGKQVIDIVPAGTEITFTNLNNQVYYNGILTNSRVFIESTELDAQTTIYSTTRQGSYPAYDGKFEIIPSNTDGKLYLINELAMKDYLHRVVPSEMPGSWDVEALKAQAIAARSYAYNQIFASSYGSMSANVDDSVNTQVYNNLPETDNVILAVDGTEGVIMTHNGECITAYYSSTSSGHTASNEDVWHDANTGSFPGTPLPYVRACQQIPGYQYPDFNDETATLNYFKDVPTAGYDYISSWYRWHVTLTREEFENTVSSNLVARENADQILGTDFVQTLVGPEPIGVDFRIGNLEAVQVIGRGAGGNILTLEIRGSNGVWRVSKEYNIRFVIRPHKSYTGSANNVILYYHNGGTYANYSILPSAFASFEPHFDIDGLITDITIYGGGNGHGVGMSQWGARGMALQGLTHEQILHNFYTDIELTKLW